VADLIVGTLKSVGMRVTRVMVMVRVEYEGEEQTLLAAKIIALSGHGGAHSGKTETGEYLEFEMDYRNAVVFQDRLMGGANGA
jgi:hypothetical protein